MRTKLTKHWHSGQQPQQQQQQQPAYTQAQQGGSFAPPPGPPTQWQQWQNTNTVPYRPPPPPQAPAISQSYSRRASRTIPPASGTLVSPEEEVKRLFKVCERAKGTARLLQEAVAYATPEEAAENPLIDEFRDKCKKSQELVCSTIPWASAEADKSKDAAYGSETREEKLLAELCVTNQELLDALQAYEDFVRTSAEQQERERATAERKLRALDAITSFTPTSSESSLVEQIFAVGDPSRNGSISAHAAYKLLTGARLPPAVLDRVWAIANVEESKAFGRHCIGVALRLVGHAQHGKEVKEELVNEVGPLAFIDGFNGPPREPLALNFQGTGASGAGPSRSPGDGVGGFAAPASPTSPSSPTAILPPLTAQDRAKFVGIFFSSGPENGMLDGQKARNVLLKSRLPMGTLGQIWELADTQQRGYLDAPAFCVAMYLVQACMSGQLSPAAIPAVLPPFVYAEASRVSSPFAQSPGSPSSRSPGLGMGMNMPEPTIGQDIVSMHVRVPSGAQSPVSPGGNGNGSHGGWAVSEDLKASSDAFFEVLDEEGRGWLDRSTVKTHLTQNGLSGDTFASIWNLADMNITGRLNRDEFAVAMYLVQNSESGQEIPRTLPPNLIPPRPSSRSVSGNQTPSFPSVTVEAAPVQEQSLLDLDDPDDSLPMPMPLPMPTSTLSTTPSSRSTSRMPSPTSSNSSAIWRSPVPPISANAGTTGPPLPPRTPAFTPIPSSPSLSQLGTQAPAPPVTSTEWTWDLPASDRASSDKHFDTLDPWKQGYVEGETAVAFLSRSKLGPEILAKIWDLADREHKGRLNKEEFAVVMFVVRGRLAGKALPESVPEAMFHVPAAPPSVSVPVGGVGTEAGAATGVGVGAASTAAAGGVDDAETRAANDEPPPPYQENLPEDTV